MGTLSGTSARCRAQYGSRAEKIQSELPALPGPPFGVFRLQGPILQGPGLSTVCLPADPALAVQECATPPPPWHSPDAHSRMLM
jgi:hypothetical protein